MLVFIAGQITTGAFVAISVVESMSSAMPKAYLPTMLAVAGHTKNKSAFFAREMCSTSQWSARRNISVTTGRLESVSNVSGETNSVACSVMMTSTFAPNFLKERTT